MRDDLVKHNLGKRALLAVAEVEMPAEVPLLQHALSEPSRTLSIVVGEISEDSLRDMAQISAYGVDMRRAVFCRAWDQNIGDFRRKWNLTRNYLQMACQVWNHGYTLAGFESAVDSMFAERYDDLKNAVKTDPALGHGVFATVEKELKEQHRGEIERDVVAHEQTVSQWISGNHYGQPLPLCSLE